MKKPVPLPLLLSVLPLLLSLLALAVAREVGLGFSPGIKARRKAAYHSAEGRSVARRA